MSEKHTPRWRKHLIGWGIALGLVGAVFAAGAIYQWNGERETDPRAMVEEYLQAIADGDAERANELVPPADEIAQRERIEVVTRDAGTPEHLESLLTNAAMADVEPISDIEVGERYVDVVEGIEGSYIDVAYSVGGERVERTLELVPDGLHRDRFQKWRIADPLISIAYVRTDRNVESFEYSVGDAELTALRMIDRNRLAQAGSAEGFDAATGHAIALYPGVYDAAFAGGELLEPATSTMSIGVEETAVLWEFETTATDALAERVATLAGEDLETCLSLPAFGNMDLSPTSRAGLVEDYCLTHGERVPVEWGVRAADFRVAEAPASDDPVAGDGRIA